ncbi:MAG TPA: hypothetical protein DEA65_01695 [Candidatus Marinimicrobia bacterium]|jgi:hypothetical protein|nr:hypothetical protein [Candidatus Neomarinimicrobiota bacterium]MDP7095157.1 hypothetical protein [Candidatus Neomarinimicrobiota bacterium]MDP7512365.1 hypothetical protein [Candidatus Neomarinimicrobiota bacterium]HBR86538.1 hypothetical protein [Candidatus Neomarinimicrobiota bacterium]HJL63053.1 hypothetical protein [Candidatus Neomarinimicrobiota bacterium]|tara:strand:+ start:526 stop:717 length:192 start_codon:yes stop_codon:yes gene_type:complete
MKLLKPKFLIEWNEIRKEGGYKLLIKKKGWVVLTAFITFYLVRDSILYLLIPYLAFKGIITCN